MNLSLLALLSTLLVSHFSSAAPFSAPVTTADELRDKIGIVEGYEGRGSLYKNERIVLDEVPCWVIVHEDSDPVSMQVDLIDDHRLDTVIDIATWNFKNPNEYYEKTLSNKLTEYGVHYEDATHCMRTQAIRLSTYSIELYLERTCGETKTTTRSNCSY